MANYTVFDKALMRLGYRATVGFIGIRFSANLITLLISDKSFK